MTTIAIKPRSPAIATGFHDTSFINNPPKLHRIALRRRKMIALDLISMGQSSKDFKIMALE
jgi:hypothetical protein